MKVSSIQNSNYDPSSCKSNSKNYSAALKSTPNDSVSFGSLQDGFKSKTIHWLKTIGEKGFFVEFLIVDTISMLLPRVWVGLERDRDKTGEFNYKAGAEEAGREILSGPSMNLIPMGIMAAACAYKATAKMGKDTIKAFTNNMNNVVDGISDLSNVTKEDLNKKLAGTLFDDAFSELNFKNGEEKSLRNRFTHWLVNPPELDKTSQKEFEKLVAEINNKGQKFVDGKEILPLDSEKVTLNYLDKEGKKCPVNVNAGNLYEDFHHYSKDAMEEIIQSLKSSATAEKAKEVLSKIEKSRLVLKFASAVASFFAVGTFLLYLPRLYQQGKVSPAEESAKLAQAETAQGGANENK